MRLTVCAPSRLLRLLATLGLILLLAGCGLLSRSDDPPETEIVSTVASPGAESNPAPLSEPAPGSSTGSSEVEIAAAEPREIVEGGLTEPRTLNPVLVADPISEELSRLIFNGLVLVDPVTGEPAPDLAESWTVSDDRLTYRFTLHEDVVWHDGQSFSARDVVFTYDLMMNDRAGSPRYSRLVERVRDVVAPDASTVVVTLIQPDASFLTALAGFGIVPEHVLSSVLPEEIVTDPFGLASAVGTGPFTLQGWSTGEQIVFERNDRYFRGPAEVDRYVYRLVVTSEDLVEGLQDGTIDWCRLPADVAESVNGHDAIQTLKLPGYEMQYVALQLDSSKSDLFLDPRMRQALMLALDRQQIVDRIWHGYAQVAHGTIPPGSWAYAVPETTYRLDQTAARHLLEEAGWVTGDDGVRERDGVRLRFTLMTNGDNIERRRMVEWMVESWRAVGVEVIPRFEKWSTVREQAVRSHDFDAVLLGFRGDIDPDQTALWASDSFFDAFNIGHYSNADVDQLLEQALATEDEGERKRLYSEVQEIVVRDLPVLPIVFPDQPIGLGPALHDVDITAILVRNRATIERWAPSTDE